MNSINNIYSFVRGLITSLMMTIQHFWDGLHPSALQTEEYSKDDVKCIKKKYKCMKHENENIKYKNEQE